MKNFILVSICLVLFSHSGLSWIKIQKTNGGFFGYRNVGQSSSGGNTVLACSNPGWSGCKMSSTLSIPTTGGELIEFSDFDSVEASVLERIISGSNKDVFRYSSDIVVRFSYNEEKDELVFELFSNLEARTIGII